MKAARYYAKQTIKVEEVPTPQAGTGEVVVQVKACGVCGTDLHIYEGQGGSAEVVPPLTLGHEAAGIVHQVGPGVTRVVPGDIVALDPNELCGACPYCLEAKGHYCNNKKCYGTTYDGAFAEYIKVNAKALYPVSGRYSFEEYAMLEPLACCLHGIDLCQIQPGNKVVVIGGGGIGLMMVQLAFLAGAARVVLLEPVKEKRSMGEQFGAVGIDPIGKDLEAELSRLGIKEPEVVIECVGRGDTILQAIDLVGPCGTVMMFGLTPPDCEIPVKPFEVFKKEIRITSSFINPYTMGRAVELLEGGRVDLKSLIATTLPLDSIVEALTNEELRRKGKIVILP